MSTNAAQEAENLEIEQVEARINADRNLNKNRRYVGTKETLAYIIYDISASFNISKYNDVFITDIVQIGLRFQTICYLRYRNMGRNQRHFSCRNH